MKINNNVRQKILLPTLKERQRYLVYSVKYGVQLNGNVGKVPRINELLVKECVFLMGIFDGAKAGLMNVKYDEDSKKGIIRVENTYVNKLKVCLGMINKINNENVNINCIYVSGMLNKAESVLTRGV